MIDKLIEELERLCAGGTPIPDNWIWCCNQIPTLIKTIKELKKTETDLTAKVMGLEIEMEKCKAPLLSRLAEAEGLLGLCQEWIDDDHGAYAEATELKSDITAFLAKGGK